MCFSVYLSYHNLISYWLKLPKKVKLKSSSLTISSPFFDCEAAGHILSIIRKQKVDRKLVHAKTMKAFPLCTHTVLFIWLPLLLHPFRRPNTERDSTALGSIF